MKEKENIRRSMSREDFVSFGSLILGRFLVSIVEFGRILNEV
jgi:hypothetical protein